jgi:DNA-binding NarL/FixJ family response regulator
LALSESARTEMPGCKKALVSILRHGLAAVLAEEPDFEFVSFAEFDHDEDLRQSLKAWAKGYLLKDAAREEIAEPSVCLV